ncbi:hypothetical protein [Bradyrhizobium sp. i1.12.3]|uniref:hypothetical protein n=1 Tax=unclassified Bradyrhizobium TaxID=2631580 RepID=UPI003D1F0AE2
MNAASVTVGVCGPSSPNWIWWPTSTDAETVTVLSPSLSVVNALAVRSTRFAAICWISLMYEPL